MIEVISGTAIAENPDRYAGLYRLRYEIFGGRLGWREVLRNTVDVDDYDRPDAVYIVVFSEDGTIVGTCRLLPTTDRYMLAEVFDFFLADQAPAHDRKVWELTRFGIKTEFVGKASLSAFNEITSQLVYALWRTCLDMDIESLLAVVSLPIHRLVLRRLGCAPAWQSHSVKIDDIPALAIMYDVAPGILERLDRAEGFSPPMIHTALPVELTKAA